MWVGLCCGAIGPAGYNLGRFTRLCYGEPAEAVAPTQLPLLLQPYPAVPAGREDEHSALRAVALETHAVLVDVPMPRRAAARGGGRHGMATFVVLVRSAALCSSMNVGPMKITSPRMPGFHVTGLRVLAPNDPNFWPIRLTTCSPIPAK